MTEEENGLLGQSADDGDEIEVEINGRKLLWAIVAVLAVLVTVQGLTLVSWGSRLDKLEGAGHSPGGAPPGVMLGGGAGTIGPATPSGASELSPADTLKAVSDFCAEQNVDEATTEKLLTLIEDSERLLGELPARESSGEITIEERLTTLTQETARLEKEATELLGDQLAIELLRALDAVQAPAGGMELGPPDVAPGDGFPGSR